MNFGVLFEQTLNALSLTRGLEVEIIYGPLSP
jgi:hypothetical protein